MLLYLNFKLNFKFLLIKFIFKILKINLKKRIMPVLFYENYAKIYYSPLFSMSTCVCTIMAVFVVLLPFFAAFASDSKNFIQNNITFLYN